MSAQILTFPEGFSTTTIPVHHGDGLSIREVTPIDSIWFSSFCTSIRLESGILLAVCSAWGLASGFKGIVYTSPRVPKPVKTFGYCFVIDSFETEMACTLATRFKAVIAGKPSKLTFRSLITYTCNLQQVLLCVKLPVNYPTTVSGVHRLLWKAFFSLISVKREKNNVRCNGPS